MCSWRLVCRGGGEFGKLLCQDRGSEPMTLTDVKSTCQEFCGLSLTLGVSDIFHDETDYGLGARGEVLLHMTWLFISITGLKESLPALFTVKLVSFLFHTLICKLGIKSEIHTLNNSWTGE